MNQENNNFNMKGNNGIPNNQPLNHQNFNQSVLNNQQPTNGFQQSSINETTTQAIDNVYANRNNSNQNFNNNTPKKKNIGLIIGIVAAVVTVVIILVVFVPKIIDNVVNNNPIVDNSETNDDVTESNSNYIAQWNDYTAYIQGVKFVFPMSFEEFQNKIAQTTYKLYDETQLNGNILKIYNFYSTSNYVEYENEVRAYDSWSGTKALRYTIKVILQNDTEEPQPVSNCTVIGLEVSYIRYFTENGTDLPYDKDVYFTEKKLQLGQSTTKAELIKKFGKANGSGNSKDIYTAGKISTGFYSFPKFQCNIDSNNKIKYMIIQNYNEEE